MWIYTAGILNSVFSLRLGKSVKNVEWCFAVDVFLSVKESQSFGVCIETECWKS